METYKPLIDGVGIIRNEKESDGVVFLLLRKKYLFLFLFVFVVSAPFDRIFAQTTTATLPTQTYPIFPPFVSLPPNVTCNPPFPAFNPINGPSAQAVFNQAATMLGGAYAGTACRVVLPTPLPTCSAPTPTDGSGTGSYTCTLPFKVVGVNDPDSAPGVPESSSLSLTWSCGNSGGQYNAAAGGCVPFQVFTDSVNNGRQSAAIAHGITPITKDGINESAGNLIKIQNDYLGGGEFPLKLIRFYNSAVGMQLPVSEFFTYNWRLNYDGRVVLIIPASGSSTANVERPDGKIYRFSQSADGSWTPPANVNARLTEQTDVSGNPVGWLYYTAEKDKNDQIEQYDAVGRLSWIQNQNGLRQTMTRDAGGRLVSVTDAFGRSLSFSYASADGSDGYLHSVSLPDGGTVSYSYGFGMYLNAFFSGVSYPDGHGLSLLFNEPAQLDGYSAFGANLLTGIVDENGNRFETYAYHGTSDGTYTYQGWANQSIKAGGVDQTTLAYASANPENPYLATYPPKTMETDASGASRTNYYNAGSQKFDTSQMNQPSAGPTPAGAINATYDAQGNMLSRTDYNGNLTCYAYDPARNLEIARVEGMAPGSVCPADLVDYATATLPNPSTERKFSTQWSPDWRQPTKIAGPKRIDAFVYDATGKIASVTSQATTDETGSNNFGGIASGAPRVWTLQFNADGQIAQISGPRVDVPQNFNFTYYPSTSTANPPLYRKGDLASESNALAQTITFDAYDGAGRLIQWTRPNGVKNVLSYTPRGWVSSLTEIASDSSSSQTTAFSYDFVGNLTKVTFPDSSWISQTFDAAHRLTNQADSAGNTAVFTLDNAGNITTAQMSDGDGTLSFQETRVYDILGGLSSATGLPGETSEWTRDAVGNPLTKTDALGNQTASFFDALNRAWFVRYPASNASQNAPVTQESLDLRGKLQNFVDPRGLTTAQVADGFGNVLATDSPDAGASQGLYDTTGNLTAFTDARGKTTNFSYDALNRRTLAAYQSGSPSVYQYDGGPTNSAPNSIGHLTHFEDESGETTLSYDAFGRLSGFSQTTSSAQTPSNTATVSWGIGTSGSNAEKLASLTLPSGAVLAYSRDGAGRVASISLNQPSSMGGGATNIASGISWTPMGQAKAWVWGNGSNFSRQFDLDGRLAQYPLGVLAGSGGLSATPGALSRTVAYDLAGRVSGYSHVDGSGSASSAIALAANQSFGNDGLGRLASFTPSATATGMVSEIYGYDISGNRVSLETGMNSYGFSVTPLSNQFATETGPSGSNIFSYDADGNLLSDGVNSWVYSDRGKMASSTNSSGQNWRYFYSALGARTMKEGPAGSAIRYVSDFQGHLLGEYDANGNVIEEIVWLGDMPLAVLTPPKGSQQGLQIGYVFADQINAPREIVSAVDNSAVWSWIQTDPFGHAQPNENPSAAGAYAFDMRLPGQVHDAETGLDHEDAGDYQSEIGRYVQTSSVRRSREHENGYLYNNSNPLTRPSGTQKLLIKAHSALACVLGGRCLSKEVVFEETTGGSPGMDKKRLSIDGGESSVVTQTGPSRF